MYTWFYPGKFTTTGFRKPFHDRKREYLRIFEAQNSDGIFKMKYSCSDSIWKMRGYHLDCSSRVFFPSDIWAKKLLYFTIVESMCGGLVWYCTFGVKFEFFMIVCTHVFNWKCPQQFLISKIHTFYHIGFTSFFFAWCICANQSLFRTIIE